MLFKDVSLKSERRLQRCMRCQNLRVPSSELFARNVFFRAQGLVALAVEFADIHLTDLLTLVFLAARHFYDLN